MSDQRLLVGIVGITVTVTVEIREHFDLADTIAQVAVENHRGNPDVERIPPGAAQPLLDHGQGVAGVGLDLSRHLLRLVDPRVLDHQTGQTGQYQKHDRQ